MAVIKVFIVDDSALVRAALADILSVDQGIKVIGSAPDPIFAMEKMSRDWPDVVILDIEMPRMDGITFLKKLMSENPTPVIICSTLVSKGAKATLDALAYGALDIINKPKIGLKEFFEETREIITNSVKLVARVNMSRAKEVSRRKGNFLKELDSKKKKANLTLGRSPKLSADVVISPGSYNLEQTIDRIVAIGTSAGGTKALEIVLRMMPQACPPVVVVQHMPEIFTRAFADRLDHLCEMNIKEAADGDKIIPGQVLIAPGNKHLLIKRSGGGYYAEVTDGPLVSRHRPSVDVLFRSVAKYAGDNALGVIMTGMGDDGARGILEMYQNGARTIAQSEKTCVVFGMPAEAIKKGAVDKIVDLEDIGQEIMNYFKNKKKHDLPEKEK